MKKLLSILLAACMLLTMLSLPAVAVEIEDAEGNTYFYHKFDFSVDQYSYANTRTSQYGDLRTYSSIVTGLNGSTDGPTSTDSVVVDYVEHEGKMAMRVRMNSTSGNGANARTAIVPNYLDNGVWTPVRLKEGNTYSFSYNVVPVKTLKDGEPRIFTEMWPNTSATGYRSTNGGGTGYGKWATAAMYDGVKLTTNKHVANDGNYVPVTGLYIPFTHQGNTGGKVVDVNTTNFGEVLTTYGEDGTTATSYNYGINGTKNLTLAVSDMQMVPLNDPDEDTDGDFDDLGDWQITWNASANHGKGAYVYNMANSGNYHYTDYMAITLPLASRVAYFEVTDYSTEELADLPFQDQIITVGDKKFAKAYSEYLITDLEVYESAKGAVNFVNGEDTTTVVGAVGETVTAPADPTKTDMVFLGWYDASGNKFEAGATFAAGEPKTYTAKFAANAVTVVDDVTIAGKDVQLNAVNYINGTAVSSYAGEGALSVTDKALVLTAPQSKEIGSTFTSSKEADYIMSAKRGDYHDYTLVGADGKPLVAESNTNYIVNISYKQTKPGRLGIKIGFGRNTAKATTVNGDHSAIGHNGTASNVIDRGNRGAYYINFGADGFPTTYNQGSDAIESVEANVDTKVQTYSFALNSGDLSSKIPEINLVTANYGVTGKLVSTSEGTSTYEVVGVPEVEIYSIQIVKVATGETVVAFTNNNPGYGDSLVYRAGTPGAAVENVPANFEGKWYNSTASTAASNTFDNKYPAATKTVYGYACVQNYSAENAASLRSYVGTKGFSMVNVDGKEMLQYKTLTNDECTTLNADKGLTNKTAAEWAGYTDDQKLAVYNEFYGRQLWNMYRLPVAETVDGHTYKATFTYKATGSMDMNLRLTLGLETNASNQDNNNNLKETKTITDTNGEWTTATIFFTVDHKATVVENTAGADDTFTKKSSYIFLHFYAVEEITDASLPDRLEITFSDIAVKDLGEVIGIEGASKLEDGAATEAGSQAMRVYFSYETTTGSNIFVDDVEYTVVNRGFVYKNGAIDRYTTNGNYNADMRKENSMIESEKTSGFNTGWAYDTENNRLWFSNYIAGFDSTMLDDKIIARGYVTFTDGTNTYTIYSDTINRSINGISHLIGDELGNL